ncbi:uncharacterized protein LOC113602691 [Acinonyx jubatus]|uniref:Uncharacterized protein LOC113602691 n=1 Tax=Acinonyx jubatus TaxID=32536 RepID=A0ABM3N7P3_ACIJB|nr:uncharacterized protein LOC113602691 [Acinonyx jubatus]
MPFAATAVLRLAPDFHGKRNCQAVPGVYCVVGAVPPPVTPSTSPPQPEAVLVFSQHLTGRDGGPERASHCPPPRGWKRHSRHLDLVAGSLFACLLATVCLVSHLYLLQLPCGAGRCPGHRRVCVRPSLFSSRHRTGKTTSSARAHTHTHTHTHTHYWTYGHKHLNVIKGPSRRLEMKTSQLRKAVVTGSRVRLPASGAWKVSSLLPALVAGGQLPTMPGAAAQHPGVQEAPHTVRGPERAGQGQACPPGGPTGTTGTIVAGLLRRSPGAARPRRCAVPAPASPSCRPLPRTLTTSARATSFSLSSLDLSLANVIT